MWPLHQIQTWLILLWVLSYYISLFQVLLLLYTVLSVSTIDYTDDIAVIDEAQMIHNNERGFAWTRVILGKTTYSHNLYTYAYCVWCFMLYCAYSLSGLPAKEIHVCGSGIAVDVVKRIVESVGERIEVKHYDRLLPLVTLNNSLGKHGWGCIQEEHNKTNRFYF